MLGASQTVGVDHLAEAEGGGGVVVVNDLFTGEGACLRPSANRYLQ